MEKYEFRSIMKLSQVKNTLDFFNHKFFYREEKWIKLHYLWSRFWKHFSKWKEIYKKMYYQGRYNTRLKIQ